MDQVHVEPYAQLSTFVADTSATLDGISDQLQGVATTSKSSMHTMSLFSLKLE